MDGIKQQIQARQVEALENRHQFEVRKIKREMRAKIDKLNEASKVSLDRLEKDYNKQYQSENNELELKLLAIRKKNDALIKEEKDRYAKMVDEIKMNHQAKINEIEIAQSNEIEKKQTEHREYLENAENRFRLEQAKLES